MGVRRSMSCKDLAEDPVARTGGTLDRTAVSPDPFFTLNSFEGLTRVGVVACCVAPARLTPIHATANVSRNRIIMSPYCQS